MNWSLQDSPHGKIFIVNYVPLGLMVCLEDGYYYFEPYKRGGVYSQHLLKLIYDTVCDLNKSWDAQVQADLGKEPNGS